MTSLARPQEGGPVTSSRASRGRLKQNYGMLLQIAVIWIMIATFASSQFVQHERGSGQADVRVLPVAVRPGQPVIASYEARNTQLEATTVKYAVWAGADQIVTGQSILKPQSQIRFQYARAQGYQLGEQIRYGVTAHRQTPAAPIDWQEVAIPPYAPEVWSSFVSFAAFSTSIMSSFTSMMYYQNTFAPASMLNVGAVMTVTLAGLLIVLELISPMQASRTSGALVRLHPRFRGLSFLLLIVFVGIVCTQVIITTSTL